MSSIYCCGPTVYDKVHLGNLRIYVFLDYFSKIVGSDLTIVNITDIDDKILDRCNKETFSEYISRYTKYYKQCLTYLNCDKFKFQSCVENIDKIISTITELDSKNVLSFNSEKNALCYLGDSAVWKNNSDFINWKSNDAESLESNLIKMAVKMEASLSDKLVEIRRRGNVRSS